MAVLPQGEAGPIGRIIGDIRWTLQGKKPLAAGSDGTEPRLGLFY